MVSAEQEQGTFPIHLEHKHRSYTMSVQVSELSASVVEKHGSMAWIPSLERSAFEE